MPSAPPSEVPQLDHLELSFKDTVNFLIEQHVRTIPYFDRIRHLRICHAVPNSGDCKLKVDFELWLFDGTLDFMRTIVISKVEELEDIQTIFFQDILPRVTA